MSFGPDDLTAHAQRLIAAGDLAGARDLLDGALADADPRPAYASAALADTAGLQARVLVALGDPQAARGWAAYAHTATTRLYGPTDERTVAAAATLAAVLHRVGSHARAARLYRDVIAALTALDGPESLRVLAAHADLATVEHIRGQCEAARDRLAAACELHREVYGDGHPAGIKMLARLGAMHRDCGRAGEADVHLALARELCRQHLPADHPLAAQVTALAGAAAVPGHVCGAAPPAEPVPVPAPGETAPPGGVTAGGGMPSPAAQRPIPADPPDEPWWPPELAPREERPGDGADARDRVTFVPAPRSAAEPPPLRTRPEPSTRALPRMPPPGDGPTRPVPPYPPLWADDPPRRRTHPLIAGTLVAIVLIAVTVIVSLLLVRDPPPRSSAPTAAPATSAPPSTSAAPSGPGPTGSASPGAAATASARPSTADGTPPQGLTMRDNRDSVTLSWQYPPGAEGPLLVSGGRRGQQPRAFQELPAGTTSYVVYGLNDRTDYCFTVAVIYSTETFRRTAPVCTARGGG
ncbi:Tetratricopeptide repeat-containing protein [Micromonospora pattaloongensis]|uniref:Tetratricopeptide repeat-containing protein n=1 Tax=Micromonospora pattaloongensis TaxID=405436 RepID=A0A1H3JFL3_9ACTN|nr:tetratricopeptide repeat protein [Micromonospora pattaloongensis]SDY38820.1 Tetratricopeptide repeat-containing protein [Micromonospora pattaloongensis]